MANSRWGALTKCLLSLSIVAGSLQFPQRTSAATVQIPQLNAYQLGNHVKIEWAVDIQPSDVLTQTSFESGEEIPNFQGGGNPQTGNQTIVSGSAFSGFRSMQLTNTQNGTGNAWWWPATSSTSSVSKFSARRIPDNSTLSITYKVRGFGGTNGYVTWSNESPWGNQGIPLTDHSGKTVYYGETINWNTTPSEFSAYVSGGGPVNFNDNDLFHIVTSHNKDHNYGLLFYRWNAAKQKFVLDPSQTTSSRPWTTSDGFGNPYTPNVDIFSAGEPVLQNYWAYVGFPGRNIPMDGQWHTVSSNAFMSDPYYEFYEHGFMPTITWTTDGVLQVDDVKFGYATKVQLYRNGNMIYQGYLSDYDDTAAIDTAGPNPVSNVNVSVSNRYPQILWSPSSGDNGTTYNYQIMGISPSGSSPLSNNYPVTVTTGLKGYSVVVDSNPNTVPDNVIETTGTSYSWPGQVSSNFYVHVAAVDNQGNLSSVVHKQYIDTVQPSLAITPSTTNWTSGNVTLTANGTDNETGINSIQKPDGQWVSGGTASYVVTGNGTYTFTAKDNAGNTRSQSYIVNNIDRTAPAQPAISVNPSGWTNSNVTVTITHGSDSQSGVQKSQYKIGSGGTWTDYTGPFTISAEGQTTIYAQTIDNVGNASPTSSANALVDKSAPAQPVLNMSTTDWTNQNVTFSITGGADAYSGTAKSQYKLGSAGAWTDYTGPVTISNEGQTDVYARTVDNVGNASAAVMSTARIDKTAPSDPSITLSESTWTQNPVTFTIGGSMDVNPVTYEYKLNDGEYTAGTGGTVTQNGVTTVSVRARDAVGNVGNEITRDIFVDNEDPTISITPNGQEWTATDVQVTIHYADAHSGVAPNKRFFKITNSPDAPGNWDTAASDDQTVTISNEGVWFVHAKVEDVAGNSFETVSQPIKMQRMPQVPGNVRVTQTTETSAQLQFDLQSGYTDGYRYEVTNLTTDQTWTLTHPNNSITDTALEGGKEYQYVVRAINHVGQSATSDPVTALTLPKAPTNVVVQKVGTRYDQATVTFDPVESATSYRIVAKDPNHNIVYNQSVTETVYQTVSGLAPGTTYTISVSAINASGEGAATNAGFLTLPAAPGNFTAVQIGEQEIRLSWDTVTSATYYQVTRNGAPIYGGPENTFFDAGLLSGTVYDYGLYAQNETGRGDLSTLSLITLPAKVENLQLTNPTTTSLRISWDEVRGASQYVIRMNGQPYQTVPFGTTSLDVTGLSPGTTYTFEVYAENASGQGVSTTTSGITLPDVPAGLQATQIGETEATLVWSPVTGADRYRVSVNGQTVEVQDEQLVVSGLTGSKTYNFTVEAGNASGYGAAETGTFLTRPYMPNHVTVSETTETTIGLKWDVVETATSYIVTQNGTIIGTPAEPAFTATGLTPGATYTYEIQAVNATGESQKAVFTWISRPAAPDGVVTVPEAYQADVTWATVNGAAQYIIEDGDTELYRGSDTRATLTGLSDGKTYQFTIRAENANGIASERTAFSFLTLPKKPMDVSATGIGKHTLTLDLSRTQVVGADRYIIERDGEEIAAIRTTYKTYQDQDLTPGTKYTYMVKAQNVSGVGEGFSFEVTTQTEPVPSGSIQAVAETNAVTLTWDTVQGAAAFQIRNTVTGDVYTTSDTSATLLNLQDGTKYTFEVSVINASGVESEGVTFEVLTKPVAPQTVGVGGVTDTSVVLDFTGSAVRGAEDFIIFRDREEIARIPATDTTFEDKGLTPGTTYTYEVKTANASGRSDAGFTVLALTLPAKVSTPAAAGDATESSVTLTWDAVPGADGYRILIGNRLVSVTEDTYATLENLTSATVYDNIRVIPYNAAGDGAAIPVETFETLPSITGLTVEPNPGTNHVEFTWDLPSIGEIIVVTYNGEEVYRGKDRHFVLENLEAGKVHSVSFHTENQSGAKTEAVNFDVLTKPEAPKKITFSPTPNSVLINFGNAQVQGAEEYIIERNGAEVGRVPVSSTIYEDTGLLPGIEYTYAVKAANGSGASDTAFTFTTTTLPAGMPKAPTPGNPGANSFDLSWEAVPGAKGYKVYIGDQLVLTTTETKVTLTGLESAKRYDNIRVVPFNDAGDGEAIAVPAFETLPSDQFTVTAVTKGTSSIEFKWELASPNEIFVFSYGDKEIYRGKDRSFLWNGLGAGRTYTVKVWAENEGGAKSAEKAVVGRTDEEFAGGGGANPPSKSPVEQKPETQKPEPSKQSEEKREVHFVDIDQAFNKDQITALAEQGVIQGVTPTRFEPQRAITRAEFAALIVRLLHIQTGGVYEGTFKDVSPGDWFAVEIAAAAKHGLVHGVGEGRFAPYEPITREQASKILANVLRKMNTERGVEGITFADQGLISQWAEADVRYLSGLQMVVGYEDGTFRPQNNLNRAEAAALIFRLKDRIKS